MKNGLFILLCLASITAFAADTLSLIDLYAFKEGDQTGSALDNTSLVLVLGAGPHSLPQEQAYFSAKAHYDFHITRVAVKNSAPAVRDDVVLRFDFGAPDATTHRQAITVAAIRGGQGTLVSSLAKDGKPIVTTSLSDIKSDPTAVVTNTVTLGTVDMTLFAGLREDASFHDAAQLSRVRAYVAGAASSVSGASSVGSGDPFRAVDKAVDAAKGFNVNAIVVRVPLGLLQANGETIFDVWATVSSL